VRHALELERKPGTPVRQFRVFPLITRVELAEDKKLKQRRQLARAELSSVAHPSDKATYFGEMEVLYVPYYAYDEVLAAISEEPQQSHSMLATYVRLVSYLTNGVINQAPALSAAKRAELLRRYDPSASTTKQLAKRVAAPAYDIFISTAPEDQAFARELFTRLQSYGHPFLATESLALGDDRDAKVARALHECRTHVIVLGTAKPRPGHWLEQEVRVALERADTDGLKVVPVLCGRDATGLTEPYASLGRFVALRTPENSVGQIAAEVARTLGVDAVDVTSLKQRALEAEGSKSELNRAKQETETRLRREIRFRNALLAVAVLAGLLSALYFQRFKKSQSDAALQAQQSTQKLTAAESRIKQSQVSVEERDQWFALLDEATRASAELRRLDVPKSVAGTSMVGLSQITEFMATVEQLEDVTKTARDKLANALKDPSLSNQTRSSLSRARDELAEQALRLPLLKSQSRALAKSTSGDSGATSAARKQAQAIWRKGYAAYLGGRYAEAKAFYEKANAADPTYAPTYNSLGRLQLDQGNSAGAIQVLQKAIDYDADYAPAHNNLAVANLMLAQAESADSKARPRYLDVADKEVKRALELRGEFPEARKTQAAIASMRSTASGDLHQAPKVPTSNATYSSSPKSSNPKTTPKSIDATIPTPYDSK
ncbi:MAG TPA: TIR domain-containing protein, partial [Polyangiaceae bacterium]